MSTVADIIARALQESKVWPAVFHAGSAAEGAAAILSALEAAGYVVTPMEPTYEMYRAAWEAMFQDPYDGTQAAMLGAGYDAMLAVRPK